MVYPGTCIRGFSDPSCVEEEGTVATVNLFTFPAERTRQQDDLIEESINWKDDDHTVDFTFSQTKNGAYHFKIGIAQIPTEEINKLVKKYKYSNALSYERAPIEGNVYHGNILLKSSVSKPLKTTIRAQLAGVAKITLRK